MSKLKHKKAIVNPKIIIIIFEVSFTKQKEENTMKILTSKTLLMTLLKILQNCRTIFLG